MIVRRRLADALDSMNGPIRSRVGRRSSRSTIVSLTFDDGWASQYESARPILELHGMRGTFFVNSGLVGSEGRVTWEELDEMASEGHEIGGHTIDHLDLTALDRTEAHRQVAEDRSRLLEHGFTVRNFAYPGGAFDAATAALVRDCGYESARAAWGLRNLDRPPGDRRPLAERVPPRDPFRILTPCCIWSTTGIERLASYVEVAERRSGGWLPLVFHRVCEGCGGEDPAPSVDPTTFSDFLGWLVERARRGTVVSTVANVVAGSEP